MKLKDVYVFADNLYFSIEMPNITYYYKTKSHSFSMTWLHGKLTQGPWNNEIEFSSIVEDDLEELSRGDYYNEVKKGITEYCNYEVMRRLKEVENE